MYYIKQWFNDDTRQQQTTKVFNMQNNTFLLPVINSRADVVAAGAGDEYAEGSKREPEYQHK